MDVVIHGGTVIDGTGAPGQKLDIGIRGGRIVELGQLSPSTAPQAIDASGLVVSPGFIDVHTHSDGWLLKEPLLAAKVSQGITTEVLMSDGISYAPLTPETYRDWFIYLRSLNGLMLEDYRGWRSMAEYLSLLHERTAQNVAALVPYANVRVLAAGWRRGPLDDTQTKLILREIDRSMAAGACGLSTGLDYVNQSFATTEELTEACTAIRAAGGLYVTHVRYKKGTLRGMQEAVEIGRRAGVKVHISHLKGSTRKEVDELLTYIDRVAVNEVDFSFDAYPYLSGSTMLNFILPYEVWEDGPLGVCAKLRDPLIRSRFEDLLAGFAVPLEHLRIAWVAGKWNAKHQGLSIAEFARRVGKTPANAVADLLIEENLAALSVIGMQPDDLSEPMVQHDRFMLGSDGIYFPGGQTHPRMYGSATRILGPMVRGGVLSLEAAVRKMTSYPAERFGLKDRGVIRTGAVADLAIFNAATVTDRATDESPELLSDGIEHVLVGGVPIWTHGRAVDPGAFADRFPGKWIKMNA